MSLESLSIHIVSQIRSHLYEIWPHIKSDKEERLHIKWGSLWGDKAPTARQLNVNLQLRICILRASIKLTLWTCPITVMLDAGAILRLQITSATNWWQIKNSFCLKGYCAIDSCFTYRRSPNLPSWLFWPGPPANPAFLLIPCSSAESHWSCSQLWFCFGPLLSFPAEAAGWLQEG